MQNPDKYLKPDQLSKTGGWTYNKDWRRNTNFNAEAVGQWQLVLTPEVAANWMPDTRRPETYASFWTPEAIMARHEAAVAAQMRIQDSIAALTATAANNTTGTSESSNNSAGLAASANGSETTATSSASAALAGSGSTGAMGTGGIASTSTTTDSATVSTNSSTVPYPLRAVNGNNFILPTLNMHIDNGSFTAYTGCNTAVGNIVVDGTSLKFKEANPLSNVECIGGFDQSSFVDRLRREDSYDVVDNQFRLKQGEQVLMVFAKRPI
jgi:heat shock protein HslJ